MNCWAQRVHFRIICLEMNNYIEIRSLQSAAVYMFRCFSFGRVKEMPLPICLERKSASPIPVQIPLYGCVLFVFLSHLWYLPGQIIRKDSYRARVLHRPVLKFPFCFNFTLVLFSFFLVVMVAHYIRPVAPSPFLFFCIIHTCILTKSFLFLSLFLIIRLL